MILPVFKPATLAEYIKSGAPEVPRPLICPVCGARKRFWRHDHFERQAFERELSATVRIERFLCSNCGLTVSCVFAFLVPYKQATAAVVAQAALDYGLSKRTYREEAEDLSKLESDAPPKPSHSQVFRWVRSICQKSEQLLLQVQKEAVMVGRAESLQGLLGVICPNAVKAHTIEKARSLNRLAELIQLTALIVAGGLLELQTHFLGQVESLQAIFCDRFIRLFTPQKVKHVIW
ncbi:MAG TPA: DUF6431 domain-containing protein [Candidatus Obscuribacterales bacterium]